MQKLEGRRICVRFSIMKVILVLSSLLIPSASSDNEPARLAVVRSPQAISLQEDRPLPPAFGPFVNLKPEDVAEIKSFRSDERIVMTYYFYWYDIYSKAHFLNGDGSDALTTHPASTNDYSYKSVRWHKGQLSDMMAAGIDVVLPVYWGAPSDHDVTAHL